MMQVAHAFSSSLNDALAPHSGVEQQQGRPLSGPERAHLGDASATRDALHVFLCQAQSLLAQRRMHGGCAYLDASAVVLEAIAEMMGVAMRAAAARIAGLEPQQAEATTWRSTIFMHLAAQCTAAGNPVPTQT
jgi:hypothetical protein